MSETSHLHYAVLGNTVSHSLLKFLIIYTPDLIAASATKTMAEDCKFGTTYALRKVQNVQEVTPGV
jgi:hypothetical protein